MPNTQLSQSSRQVVILPAPLELASTGLPGTSQGPQALLKAGNYVEWFDEERNLDLSVVPIVTLPPVFEPGIAPQAALELISRRVASITRNRAFPIVLGGDHCLSCGVLSGLWHGHCPPSLLWLDAHLDLRKEYLGTKHNHACAMRLSLPYVKQVAAIGYRAICPEELDFVNAQSNVELLPAHEFSLSHALDLVDALTSPVYISIDADVFDPAVVPGVAVPEPGGLNWVQVVEVVKYAFARHEVIGCDIVEFRPIEGQLVSDNTLAKLIWRVIGYWWKKPEHTAIDRGNPVP